MGMLVFFAIIAVMGVVFWFVLPDGPETVTEEDVAVELRAVQVREARLGDETLWNVTVLVEGVEPDGFPVPWDEVQVVLRSADQVVLHAMDVVHDLRDSKGALDAHGVVPAAWYSHEDGEDPVVSPEDSLVLSGLSREYEGGRLELLWRGHLVGVAVLPTTFD